MLTVDEKQYKQFAETVSNKMENRYPMQDANCKCIILPTHTDAIHIILSENELLRLHEMFQSVDTDMRIRELMDLF